jgi:hypothetical protein
VRHARPQNYPPRIKAPAPPAAGKQKAGSGALQGFNYALLAGHRSGQQGGKADDVRVEFLGFQREIVEGNIDAEIENLEAARREHDSCGLHRFAREEQVGKKHFALLELLADGVQSQNKAAINGFEWVDALGEGALAECSGAIGIPQRWIASSIRKAHRT